MCIYTCTYMCVYIHVYTRTFQYIFFTRPFLYVCKFQNKLFGCMHMMRSFLLYISHPRISLLMMCLQAESMSLHICLIRYHMIWIRVTSCDNLLWLHAESMKRFTYVSCDNLLWLHAESTSFLCRFTYVSCDNVSHMSHVMMFHICLMWWHSWNDTGNCTQNPCRFTYVSNDNVLEFIITCSMWCDICLMQYHIITSSHCLLYDHVVMY